MRCWGRGAEGQLGYGDTDDVGDDETPAAKGNVPIGVAAKQLVAGQEFTCALLEGGGVRCWGRGHDGQLGYGDAERIGDDETPETKDNVDLGAAVEQLTAGEAHVCARIPGGNVRCWGWNIYGQLGYGHKDNIGDDELPAAAGDVSVGAPVREVVAGGGHTCALLESGGLRCWGLGRDGQLGYGKDEYVGDDEAPSLVGDVPIGAKVKLLAASRRHTCGVFEDDSLRCWGYAKAGLLGVAGEKPVLAAKKAKPVELGAKVKGLDAADGHTCVVSERGEVVCWGLATDGRLGYGNVDQTIGDDEAPAKAGVVDVGARVVQVVTGAQHTCALLEAGDVRCWGLADQGQLGHGNTESIGGTEGPRIAGSVPLL